MSGVRLARSALDDLLAMQEYYREQGVAEVGRRLTVEIVAHIEQLHDHPGIGRVVPEFQLPSLRELIHPPFRIVYWKEARRIVVVRVWRSERLLRLPDK